MFKEENYNLEFKEEISQTFLKTVSAFSNYWDGQIIFGIRDNGEVIGLDKIQEKRQKIEHMINDCIKPRPDFGLEVGTIEGKQVLILKVLHGDNTPYYFKNKAYKRADTSDIEVDRLELNRLVMGGANLDFEGRKAFSQELTFEVLETKLTEIIQIDKFTPDILKALNLLDKDGEYNIAGELFADRGSGKLLGIDMVKFGSNRDEISYRETLSNISILSQYDKAVEIFERHFQIEKIEGYSRLKQELIPKEAFREALANAIVHRTWDAKAHIQIAMFPRSIEINSPGGLPVGISDKEYLSGGLSVLRNPIIAGIFYRLGLIEKFGTGIRRINNAYQESITKPSFNFSPNSIKVTLPLFEEGYGNLSNDEIIVYNVVQELKEVTRRELDTKTKFGKDKNLRLLNNLLEKGVIKRVGSGPGTKYALS